MTDFLTQRGGLEVEAWTDNIITNSCVVLETGLTPFLFILFQTPTYLESEIS